ncbi:MAG: corrinoid protein [Candidatus Aminicenantia bacterium]
MARAIIEGDREESARLARMALEMNISPQESIDSGFAKGIKIVGEMWERGEYFLPELLIGAEAMKSAIDVLTPHIISSKSENIGKKVVIGTVEGDIHDIGKNLVASMLMANGFDVIDLGADVPLENFIITAEKESADFICMSALLTTTMIGQKKVIEMLKEKGIRERFKVLVGGAPVNEEWAKRIEADGTASNAAQAVSLALSLIK